MEVQLTCTYCDHKFIKSIYNTDIIKSTVCQKCGDRNLKAKELSSVTIDSYEGCPPFPEKVIKKEKSQESEDSMYPYWNLG